MRIVAIICFIGGLAFIQPPNWESKVNTELLQQIEDGSSLSFLIQMKSRADLSQAAYVKGKDQKAAFVYEQLKRTSFHSQQDILRNLESYDAEYHSFFIVNMIKVKGDRKLLRALARRDDVSYIFPDFAFNFDLPVPQNVVKIRDTEPEWGLKNIKADSVWEMGYKGSGIVVAGQDTGYEWHHPALSKQYRGNQGDTVVHDYNWFDAIHEDIDSVEENPCGYNSLVPCDDHSHGTHTMGTMVGYTEDNIIGVAPEAKWIACRNMDQGTGIPSTYIECFEWFLAPTDLNGENPDPTKSPHVINNSWSCPESEGCNMDNFTFMEEAMSNVKAAGIFLSIAAGNSGSSCSTVSNPPAFFENSFAVGAYRNNDTISGFSSRGPAYSSDSLVIMKPNISAPGSGVRSAKLDSTYGKSSGTSMAAPHVAGAVALVLSAVPKFEGEVEYLERLFEETARPATTDQECDGLSGSEVPNYTYGYGRIDVLAAVKKALIDASVNTELLSKQTSVEIFPNPFASYFSVKNLTNDQTKFSIHTFQGKLIGEWTLQGNETTEIKNTSLQSGIYILVVREHGRVYSQKIVKTQF